jgi:hypothetical protein
MRSADLQVIVGLKSDVKWWGSSNGWREMMILCVVICSYCVVSSRSSFTKEQFYDICWRFGDLMTLRRFQWSDVVLLCSDVISSWYCSKLLQTNFIRCVWDVVFWLFWEDCSEVIVLCFGIWSSYVVCCWSGFSSNEFCDVLTIGRLGWVDDIMCCDLWLWCCFLLLMM